MILAVDVQYVDNSAYIAGVMFETWNSETCLNEYLSYLKVVEKYQSGSFYKRELPCILKLLDEHQIQPDIIVIDGYVYLDDMKKAGLGKYLYDSLERKTEIVGVAKKQFLGINENNGLFRGFSEKPLYITSTGNLEDDKQNIASMFGDSRIPVLLKRVDKLCRKEASKELTGRSNYGQ